MSAPVLSVILPIRGRSKYLDLTLKNLSVIHDNRVEILILDNSLPEFSNLVVPKFKSNFRIEYADSQLTMTQNFFRGLRLAKGDWICFIGGDDGLIPGNVKFLIDFLEFESREVVSTHPIYFQYELEYKEPWADLPKQKLSIWRKKINYLSLLAALFPGFKLDLPVPYNRNLVRRTVFESFIRNFDDIPAGSPDDFLGQYISQMCKIGTYIEIPVFIHTGTAISNGFQSAKENPMPEAQKFLKDSRKKYGTLLNEFGIECSFAMAFDHYASAREASGRGGPSRVAIKFYKIWTTLFCPYGSHHKTPKTFSFFRNFFLVFHSYSFRALRKVWQIRNFGLRLPVANEKVKQPLGMDVCQLSNLLSKSLLSSNIPEGQR
jgi:glycosyltransferase involved in cell wall biosynthesis